jgi:hypothetical protein
VKPSLEKACVPARVKKAALWLAIILPLYILSTGPVAWATNDGCHRRYLPEAMNAIYLPLVPLMKVECINQAFYYYTAVIWGGFPTGYTTL